MIKFKKIFYKNILAVGNHGIEIDLIKTQTTLISGFNGGGKSTFAEALIFALYGKPFRKIKKGQLVNSVNKKGLLVELWFDKGDKSYHVKRGIGPNLFEIYENGELIDQSAVVRDYQAEFEANILQMNYRAFTQTVMIGMATYVPFMELPAGARREFIEELLDYSIFSKMNQLLKEDANENKHSLNDVTKDIDNSKRMIETIRRHNAEILQMKNKNEDAIYKAIDESLEIAKIAKEKALSIEDEIVSISVNLKGKDENRVKMQDIDALIRDFSNDLSSHRKTHKFFSSNETCPTCEQTISEQIKKAKILAEDEHIESKSAAIDKLNKMADKLSQKALGFAAVEKQIGELRAEQQRCEIDRQAAMKILRAKKAELDAEKPDAAFKNDELTEAENQLVELKKRYDAESAIKKINASTASILKDSGIKAHAVKKYVQVINDLINQYLYSFGLYVDFHLDENFEEVIKSRYRDEFSFASFSEGEKMRINFAIMFAWRNLSKIRNSMSTNLLILDETLDGVVDTDGIGEIIKTLKQLNENDNIFVISHRADSLSGSFDRNIVFKKDQGFTVLEDESMKGDNID